MIHTERNQDGGYLVNPGSGERVHGNHAGGHVQRPGLASCHGIEDPAIAGQKHAVRRLQGTVGGIQSELRERRDLGKGVFADL